MYRVRRMGGGLQQAGISPPLLLEYVNISTLFNKQFCQMKSTFSIPVN
jgi:hypothetical protein